MSISNSLRSRLRVAIGNPSATSELISVLDTVGEMGNGNKFYVDSGSGNSANDGKSWLAPKATLAQAISAATADNGDVIFLAPGHAQTITGAAGAGITKAGLRVIGLGSGRQRPIFTFTSNTGASFDITVARTLFTNCVLVNAIDAQTAMVNVTGADCEISDCEFFLGDSSTQAVLGILGTTADRLRVLRNHMHGGTTAGVSAAVRVVGAADAQVIEDNVIVGAFGATGGISNITTAVTMLSIRRNVILNNTADGNNKVIVADAATTGIIADNRFGIIDSTCPAPITAAAMNWAGNWSANNVNAQSTLV